MDQLTPLDFSISIVEKEKINSAFTRANAWLLDKHIDLFHEKDTVHNFNLLENLWSAEFKASLVFDHNLKIYSKIKFDTSEDMTIFLIRWG
jgi:hypothetical protein